MMYATSIWPSSTLMILAALAPIRFGLAAERRSLEPVAPPLSSAD